MLKRFLPKQPKFFEFLNSLAGYSFEVAKLLDRITASPESLDELAAEIHIIENKCDEISHMINNELNDTFVTPIDREDIFAITNALDDVVDGIDRVASKLKMYRLKTPLKFGHQLSAVLLSQTELLSDAIKLMPNNFKDTMSKLVSIRNLETEGDSIFRDSITYLFENEPDVIEIIKKKEILENYEKAVDKCQTATLAIEGALIKNV
jgi:predicted phosphate transport protein (TIGR00153 family)